MEKRGRGRPKGSKNIPHPVGESNLLAPKGGKGLTMNLSGQHFFKNSTHEYTELEKTAITSSTLYNLYGVIVDATTPARNAEKGYSTYVRIMDPSMFKAGGACSSIQLYFKSIEIEKLPSINRVGDIIRVHRASIGTYKGGKTFYVNMNYGSAWVIFEGAPGKTVHTFEAISEDEGVQAPMLEVDKNEEKASKAEQAISRFFGFNASPVKQH